MSKIFTLPSGRKMQWKFENKFIKLANLYDVDDNSHDYCPILPTRPCGNPWNEISKYPLLEKEIRDARPLQEEIKSNLPVGGVICIDTFDTRDKIMKEICDIISTDCHDFFLTDKKREKIEYLNYEQDRDRYSHDSSELIEQLELNKTLVIVHACQHYWIQKIASNIWISSCYMV